MKEGKEDMTMIWYDYCGRKRFNEGSVGSGGIAITAAVVIVVVVTTAAIV